MSEAVRETARDAGIFADAVTRHLLAASSHFAGRELRRECLVAVFRAWPALCARMSELETLAPMCREEGYEQATKLLEIVNRKDEAA